MGYFNKQMFIFSISSTLYDPIFSKFFSFSNSKLEKVVSQIIITQSENFFLSPLKWDNLTKKQRTKVMEKFLGTAGRNNSNFLNESPPINLFQSFKK